MRRSTSGKSKSYRRTDKNKIIRSIPRPVGDLPPTQITRDLQDQLTRRNIHSNLVMNVEDNHDDLHIDKEEWDTLPEYLRNDLINTAKKSNEKFVVSPVGLIISVVRDKK